MRRWLALPWCGLTKLLSLRRSALLSSCCVKRLLCWLACSWRLLEVLVELLRLAIERCLTGLRRESLALGRLSELCWRLLKLLALLRLSELPGLTEWNISGAGTLLTPLRLSLLLPELLLLLTPLPLLLLSLLRLAILLRAGLRELRLTLVLLVVACHCLQISGTEFLSVLGLHLGVRYHVVVAAGEPCVIRIRLREWSGTILLVLASLVE